MDGVPGDRSATSVEAFIVDGNDALRRRLRQVLAASKAVTVTGEASGARQARDRIRAHPAQIVVIGHHLIDDGGPALCRALGAELPAIRCVFYGPGRDRRAIAAAREAGGFAYIPSSAPDVVVVDTVRAASRARRPEAPAAPPGVRRQALSVAEDPRLGSLTARDIDILDRIVQGHSNRRIGAELHLADTTVRNCVSSLFGKLGIENRRQAAAVAARLVERRERGADLP